MHFKIRLALRHASLTFVEPHKNVAICNGICREPTAQGARATPSRSLLNRLCLSIPFYFLKSLVFVFTVFYMWILQCTCVLCGCLGVVLMVLVSGHIKKVKLHQARLELGLVTTFSSVFSSSPSAWPSLGDGFGHCQGRNGEFCVVLGPVTRIASMLAYCIVA